MSGPYEVDRHQVALRKAMEAISDLPKTYMLENSDMEAAIKAYLYASGMVMVPREPTDEMLDIISDGVATATGNLRNNWTITYKSMIAAATNPFQTPEESREKK